MPDGHDTSPRPFETLTGRGQVRRLRDLATNVLAKYDLRIEHIRLLKTGYNTIFRIDTADGKRFVLRVNYPGERTLTDIRSETAWLAALRRDTDLTVPEPLATRDGDLVVTAEARGAPEPRHCVVFGWIDGRNVRRRLSRRTVHLMGEAMARLHDHADTFQPPPGFTDLSLNEIWGFGVPEQVYSDEPAPDFTPARRAMLREAASRVQAALDHLYQDHAARRYIHADLHYGNIRLDHGRLNLLDFDDSAWGYPVQDIGIALFYLQRLSTFDELRTAFMEGYGSLRQSPEAYDGQIDAMIAYRRLDLLSYLVQAEHPDIRAMVPGLLASSEERLGMWLASGLATVPSPSGPLSPAATQWRRVGEG